MVTQTTYPGVYIEEVPSDVHTISAVATSITVFFGRTSEGPVFKATRIQSLSEFTKTFGPPIPDSELSTSVRLFFQNGGTDCYIVRLVKINDDGTITGAKASIVLKNEEGTKNVFRVAAKEIGTWGNELALDVDYNTPGPEDTFHLRVYRLDYDGTVKEREEFLNCSADKDSPKFVAKFVSQTSRLIDCEIVDPDFTNAAAAAGAGYSESRQPFETEVKLVDKLKDLTSHGKSKLKISIDGSSVFDIDLKGFDSETPALDADKIKSKINKSLPASLADKVKVEFINWPNAGSAGKIIRFSSDTVDKKSIVIQPSQIDDLAKDLMLGIDQGGIERSRYALLRPAPTGIFLDFEKINALSNEKQNSFNSMTLDGETIEFVKRLETVGPDNKWYESGAGNSDGVREKLGIIASGINDKQIGWTASVAGSRMLLKKNSGLPHSAYPPITTNKTAPDDIGPTFKTNTKLYSLGTGTGGFVTDAKVGINGEPPNTNSYTGNQDAHTGFYALDEVDLFNIMVIPRDQQLSEEKYQSLWGPASVYCKEHRAFLIVEPLESWLDYRTVLAQKASFRNGVEKKNAAIYFPRLLVRENGIVKAVGPGGAMAGLYSRIDSSGGGGVWKAPAGTSADIQAITDVEIVLTDSQNGSLNREGINCLRRFPTGIVSWGARTIIGGDDFGSEWKYVPIRRTALMIHESLFRGTKFAVFEPNDEPLYAKIRLNVGAFMMRLFKQGAFQGSDPNKAFFVKCDGETTTQVDRDLGIVNILVGFAPLKPAEFVIIKIQQMAGDL